jgi:hypothetical protein
VICTACQTENREDAGFCRRCGAALQVVRRRRNTWRVPPLRLIWRTLVVVAIAGGVIVLATSPLGRGLASIATALSREDPPPTVVTSESLVQGIHALSQLTTARYTIQTIVAVEDRGRFGAFTADRILLRANADVLAGIDLGAITADRVQISGSVIRITLPPPTLVSTDISYHVYDRDRGLFAPTNKDLQTLAEKQAHADILRTACEKGILEEAQRNAETTLRAFMASMGYPEVEFTATAPASDTCANQ